MLAKPKDAAAQKDHCRALAPETDRLHGRRGLTLVKSLAVLLGLAVVAVVSVPLCFDFNCLDCCCSCLGCPTSPRQDTAGAQIERLGSILERYRLDMGRYPSTGEGLQALIAAPVDGEQWNGPYLERADGLIVPWGHPFDYRAPGAHGEYDLFTLGADRVEGGVCDTGDVTNW